MFTEVLKQSRKDCRLTKAMRSIIQQYPAKHKGYNKYTTQSI